MNMYDVLNNSLLLFQSNIQLKITRLFSKRPRMVNDKKVQGKISQEIITMKNKIKHFIEAPEAKLLMKIDLEKYNKFTERRKHIHKKGD